MKLGPHLIPLIFTRRSLRKSSVEQCFRKARAGGSIPLASFFVFVEVRMRVLTIVASKILFVSSVLDVPMPLRIKPE